MGAIGMLLLAAGCASGGKPATAAPAPTFPCPSASATSSPSPSRLAGCVGPAGAASYEGSIKAPSITGFHGTLNGPQKEVCTGSWAGNFTISVAADGTVTGQGRVHTLGQPNCTFHTFADASTAYSFTIEAHTVPGGLELRPDPTGYSPSGAHDYDFFDTAFFGYIQSLHGRGQAVYEIPVSGGSGSAVFHVTRLSKHSPQTGNFRVGSTATILISVSKQQ